MKTKTVSVSELNGAALDWAVAQVESIPCYTCPNSPHKTQFVNDEAVTFGRYIWSPSTDWGQGGTLIDRFKVNIYQYDDGEIAADCTSSGYQKGPTPLIASCRAIVDAKLGGTVEVPEELL